MSPGCRNSAVLVPDQATPIGNMTGFCASRLRTAILHDPLHRLTNNLSDGLEQAHVWHVVGMLVVVCNALLGSTYTISMFDDNDDVIMTMMMARAMTMIIMMMRIDDHLR
eukprot:12412200-Karenia_brevis.AAC.1